MLIKNNCSNLFVKHKKIVASSILSIPLVLSANAFAENVDTCSQGAQTGLVACYSFEDNANDGSVNENHGVEHGDVEYVVGQVNKAIKLDGIGDYIRVVDPQQKFDTQYTITGWVSTEGSGQAILSKYSWKAHNNLGFSLSSIDNTVFTAAVFNERWVESKYPSYKIPSNTFKYISAVYNEGHIQLYIDGISVSESTLQKTATLNNGYDILIGNFFQNYGSAIASIDGFAGLIDELRIYNRALSEAEIKELYGVTADSGNYDDPLSVDIAGFAGQFDAQSQSTVLTWEALSAHLGFYVFRAELQDGKYTNVTRLNNTLYSNQGASDEYTFIDDTAVAGKVYHYGLESIDFAGEVTQHMEDIIAIEAK
ncbi:LamG domain-containing protein [Candidatus Albibeggiatoa sp. nov. NOAA]|uniref:LamG domain-containing protein n=1 Tax=Candidatus Albibeggiatoa sp. nov. NOAA TaxID=3162724 RepID=UPI0032FD550A|nr:LamG domain-containing protein [Thiotrichaceae bacterium]